MERSGTFSEAAPCRADQTQDMVSESLCKSDATKSSSTRLQVRLNETQRDTTRRHKESDSKLACEPGNKEKSLQRDRFFTGIL